MQDNEEIINELFDVIENSIKEFEVTADSMQNEILKEVNLIIKDLDLDAKGNIKSTLANLRRISVINNKVEKVIKTPEYKSAVRLFVSYFKEVQSLNNKYYSKEFDTFREPKTSEEIKQIAIDQTLDDLLGTGLDANVIDDVKQLITENIKTKQSYSSLQTQLKNLIVGNKDNNGKLVAYTGQITTDSINVYARNYDKIITDELKPVWFKYLGALVKDSRIFCEALVAKKYVHISEFGKISLGEIDNHKVSLQGLFPNTNKNNLIVNCGGYRCNHKMLAVSEFNVPIKIKSKFETK